MFHAIYTTCGMPCDDDPYTLLHAAIVAQAARDVYDKSLSERDRRTARMWLDARGIRDEDLPRIRTAFTLWKRANEAQR